MFYIENSVFSVILYVIFSKQSGYFLYMLVAVLVFYGHSTHFRTFRARSVNLVTLFLDKPPRQFTNT